MTAESLPLTNDAQRELDRYLRRVRAALRVHPSVDADEVERDIRSHIDAELAASPPPVTDVRLRAVLDRLGSPSQWVPGEDLPVWRTALIRLQSGPEDWRLAYVSFVLFVAGPLLGGTVGALLFLASVLLARGALEALADEDEPVGARRWLLYPSLVVVYLGLLAVILLVPPAMVAALEDPSIQAEALSWLPSAFRANVPLLIGVVAGVWWVLLGLAARRWPGAVHALFRPFGDRLRSRHGTRLVYAGLLLLAFASTTLLIVTG